MRPVDAQCGHMAVARDLRRSRPKRQPDSASSRGRSGWAPELWKVIGKALDSEPVVHEWVEILDWYHLDERLTKCLELCVPDSKRSALRRRWHKQLNTDGKSIRSVTRSLKSRARKLDTQS